MIDAMEQQDMEPVVVEDLVRYGEHVGYERGVREGIERGVREGVERGAQQALELARRNLFELAATRNLALSEAQRARIDAELTLERLLAWLPRVATVGAADDLQLT